MVALLAVPALWGCIRGVAPSFSGASARPHRAIRGAPASAVLTKQPNRSLAALAHRQAVSTPPGEIAVITTESRSHHLQTGGEPVSLARSAGSNSSAITPPSPEALR